MINVARFGQGYVSKVANPDDILLFKRIVKRVGKRTGAAGADECVTVVQSLG